MKKDIEMGSLERKKGLLVYSLFCITLPIIAIDITYPLHEFVEFEHIHGLIFYDEARIDFQASLKRALVLREIGLKGDEAKYIPLSYLLILISLMPILVVAHSHFNLFNKGYKRKCYRKIFESFEMVYEEGDSVVIPEVFGVTEKSFFIKYVKDEKKLRKYLSGILEKLNEKNVINFLSGEIVETGYPGKYEIKKIDKKEGQMMSIFLEIGWYHKYFENGIEKKTFPSVNITNEYVELSLNGIKLSDTKIQKGINLFEKYLNLKLDSDYNLSVNKVIFKILKEHKRLFDKGDVSFNFDKWYENIVVPMKESEKEVWFCGEVTDPTVSFDSERVFFPIPDSSHGVVIGMTGSGKTKTLVHLCIALSEAYPGSKWFFADGKGGADLSPLAKRISDYDMAIPDINADDKGIQFANVVHEVWNEYNRRKKAWAEMRELGFNPSTYLEAREIARENDLPQFHFERYFLVIDELKAFWDETGGSPDKLVNIPETIPNIINRLLAESRSYGFTIILCSQDYKYTTFPTIMRGNLTTQYIHKQETKNCTFLEIPDADTLGKGEFFFRANGMMDNKGHSLFRMAMPYIGDDPEKVMDKLGMKVTKKNNWNYDLIYNKGGGLDPDKLDISSLSTIIRQVFFRREGFEILETYPADEMYVSSVVYDTVRRVNIAVGVISTDDIDLSILENNLKIEAETSDILETPKIFFIAGDKMISKWKEVLEMAYGLNAIVVGQKHYAKLLKQAYRLYKLDDKKPIFRPLMNSLIGEQMKSKEAQIDDMYGGEGSVLSSNQGVWGEINPSPPRKLDPQKEIEPKTEKKKKESISEILKKDQDGRSTPYKDNINMASLQAIRDMKNTNRKGVEAERFVLELERACGHDTVFMRELIVDKTVSFTPNSGTAEGGIDLIRWINRKEKKVVIVQVKNQPSRKIGTPKLDEFMGCGAKYPELDIVGYVFYNISGYFAKGVENYRAINTINKDDMERIVRNIERNKS